MEAWKTLKTVIPDGQVKAVAARMRVSHDYVLRWRREQFSDETPMATGMASPLSRTCDLIDAIFLVNPIGSGLVVEHVALHHELLTNAHNIRGFQGDPSELALASADLLTQATSAVVSLSTEGEDTLRKLVLLRDATVAAISRVGKDLYYRDQRPLRETPTKQ
jgi:hypothetical protein